MCFPLRWVNIQWTSIKINSLSQNPLNILVYASLYIIWSILQSKSGMLPVIIAQTNKSFGYFDIYFA